jgi:hypothetical protein
MANDNLLKKVRDLLALAEHANTNEHEAMAAEQKAAMLIFKYGLDESQVRGSKPQEAAKLVKGDMHPFPTKAVDQAWASALLWHVSSATLTKNVYQPAQNTYNFIGTTDAIEAAEYFFTFICREIDARARAAWKLVRLQNRRWDHWNDRYEYTTTPANYRYSFASAAVTTIGKRFAAMKQQASEGSNMALVVVAEGELDAALAEFYPHLNKTRKPRGRTIDSGAYRRGAVAGAEINLNNPLRGSNAASTLRLGAV